MPTLTNMTLWGWVALLLATNANFHLAEAAWDSTHGNSLVDGALSDMDGLPRQLSEWRDHKLLVVVFLGVECPMSKLYTSRLNELADQYSPESVKLVGIFSNRHDDPEAIRQFVADHGIRFTVLKDVGNVVADQFGAERITQAFAMDEQRTIQYAGRIDDQYAVGIQRSLPTTNDLRDAIDQLLADESPAVPRTAPVGCIISREQAASAADEVTYTGQIAAILDQHCAVCHRPGQAAPFSLLTYQAAADWAYMMQEVIEDGRMPPWHADTRHGHFSNDISLTSKQKQLFNEWIEAGTPEGDPAARPPLPQFPKGWKIGTPDAIVSMPKAFTVPAEGIIEYQYIEVDPHFDRDVWVTAAEIQPSNPAVVHHCNVFLKPPGQESAVARGTLGSFCLIASAVGTPPASYPAGMAKLIPKDWKLLFVMHYVAVGSEQTDITQLGLRIAQEKTVEKEIATRILLDEHLNIPPHAKHHEVRHEWKAPQDVLLFSMFPHMHLRGRSFRYEALYPDGQSEILLSVPKYDFNWQNRYVLAKPKTLAKGTVVRCTGIYDNSADNPFNPDPTVTVYTGPQVEDEMFNGYFDVALANENRQALTSRLRRACAQRAILVVPGVVMGLLLLAWATGRRRAPHAEALHRSLDATATVGPDR